MTRFGGAGDRLGEARLVGGQSDSAAPPAWQYGLMEVHDGFIFAESRLNGAAAAVACQSLGFGTGVQLFFPGDNEALSEPPSEASRIRNIECSGGEADPSASDCDISGQVNRVVEKYRIIREFEAPHSSAQHRLSHAAIHQVGVPPDVLMLRPIPRILPPKPRQPQVYCYWCAHARTYSVSFIHANAVPEEIACVAQSVG